MLDQQGPAMSEGTKFFFRGIEVGELAAGTPMVSGGRRPYMPYRGPGHYAMQMALQTQVPACCETFGPTGRVEFEVLGCPEYGVLEIGAVNAPSEHTNRMPPMALREALRSALHRTLPWGWTYLPDVPALKPETPCVLVSDPQCEL